MGAITSCVSQSKPAPRDLIEACHAGNLKYVRKYIETHNIMSFNALAIKYAFESGNGEILRIILDHPEVQKSHLKDRTINPECLHEFVMHKKGWYLNAAIETAIDINNVEMLRNVCDKYPWSVIKNDEAFANMPDFSASMLIDDEKKAMQLITTINNYKSWFIANDIFAPKSPMRKFADVLFTHKNGAKNLPPRQIIYTILKNHYKVPQYLLDHFCELPPDCDYAIDLCLLAMKNNSPKLFARHFPATDRKKLAQLLVIGKSLMKKYYSDINAEIVLREWNVKSVLMNRENPDMQKFDKETRDKNANSHRLYVHCLLQEIHPDIAFQIFSDKKFRDENNAHQTFAYDLFSSNSEYITTNYSVYNLPKNYVLPHIFTYSRMRKFDTGNYISSEIAHTHILETVSPYIRKIETITNIPQDIITMILCDHVFT